MILLEILLLAGLVAAGALLLKRILAKRGISSGRALFITLSVVIVLVILALAVSGRLNWIAAVGAALIPFLRQLPGLLRYLPRLFSGAKRPASQGSSQSAQGYSEVDSEYLRMTLHHASGAMDGEILKGSRSGSFLGELNLTELLDLKEEFHDPDSKRLLESYLDQAFPGWNANNTNSGSQAGSQDTPSRAQSLEILGLQPGASKEEIVHAHRKLMQRVHPDRGGSSFLAAQLNEAKDVLLKTDR